LFAAIGKVFRSAFLDSFFGRSLTGTNTPFEISSERMAAFFSVCPRLFRALCPVLVLPLPTAKLSPLPEIVHYNKVGELRERFLDNGVGLLINEVVAAYQRVNVEHDLALVAFQYGLALLKGNIDAEPVNAQPLVKIKQRRFRLVGRAAAYVRRLAELKDVLLRDGCEYYRQND
jgi:hypothetical protein